MVLNREKEALIVALRRYTSLPLDGIACTPSGLPHSARRCIDACRGMGSAGNPGQVRALDEVYARMVRD